MRKPIILVHPPYMAETASHLHKLVQQAMPDQTITIAATYPERETYQALIDQINQFNKDDLPTVIFCYDNIGGRKDDYFDAWKEVILKANNIGYIFAFDDKQNNVQFEFGLFNKIIANTEVRVLSIDLKQQYFTSNQQQILEEICSTKLSDQSLIKLGLKKQVAPQVNPNYTEEYFTNLLRKSDEEFLQDLLDDKNLIAARIERKATLLHFAIRAADPYLESHDHFNIDSLHRKIKYLLQHGARLDATDEFGQTPIHIATKYALVSTLPILLDNILNQHFDFNKKDNSGNTILMIAAEPRFDSLISNSLSYMSDSSNQMVPLILKAGSKKINVNDKNPANSTPLALAVNGYQSIAAIALVRAGADPEIKFDYDTSGSKTKINIFELIDQKISLHEDRKDMLDTLKEHIILERLIFLTEQSLKNYKNSRAGIFSIKPDQQRLQLITEIETSLRQIKESVESMKDKPDVSLIKQHTQQLAGTLKSCAQSAEAHHKKHGTLMFFGHGPTSSGFARELNKAVSQPLFKDIDTTALAEAAAPSQQSRVLLQ